MQEDVFINLCAPTLAGIKTANMFPIPYESQIQLRQSLRSLNRTLGSKGVRVIQINEVKNKALLYVYRPKLLTKDLKRKDSIEILKSFGYCNCNPSNCIIKLKERFKNSGEFPHEIGLFLGYPPEDVKGFIVNKGSNFKCCGCWKVYGDEDSACKCFENYNNCRCEYRDMYSKGYTIDELTVCEGEEI